MSDKKIHRINTRKVIIFILLCEIVFIGVPIHYKYHTYKIVEYPNIISGIEFIFRITARKNNFWELIPISKGNPYEINIDAYGEKERHKVINMKSLEIIEGKKVIKIISPEKPSTYKFIAHSIWLTHIYPEKKFVLNFKKDTMVKMRINMEIIEFNNKEELIIEKKFVAKERSGWLLFSLIHIIMSIIYI